MEKILVIGSSNTDLITQVESFPAAGETIEGLSFMQAMGGKGANQAVAAHKLGGKVKFITSLGKDANGVNTMNYYNELGLDVSSSLIVDDVSSGTAVIWVDKKGENCIVITPGANKMLSPVYVRKIETEIATADIIMLQMEIPYESVKTVCQLAHKHRKKVILNDAPAYKLDKDIMQKIDILIVNETEAEMISGLKIENVGSETVAEALLSLGAKTVVLTLGKNGGLVKNEQISVSYPAFVVKATDTTAAGDTFCGALAAEISRGHDWNQALRFASAASAICVTRMGAQPSIPTEKEVKEFLESQKQMAF